KATKRCQSATNVVCELLFFCQFSSQRTRKRKQTRQVHAPVIFRSVVGTDFACLPLGRACAHRRRRPPNCAFCANARPANRAHLSEAHLPDRIYLKRTYLKRISLERIGLERAWNALARSASAPERIIYLDRIV